MKTTAVIDIGSNSVRLVLFEITASGFKVIDDMKETVRLGEGLEKSTLIKEESIRRTIKTLRMFCSVCQAHQAPILAVATAAARKAENGDELIRRIKTETGIDVRIISGEEEALLDYQGVIHSLDVQDGLILDIGGGSSELVWFKNCEAVEVSSLPFGSLDLTHTFGLTEALGHKRSEDLNQFLLAAFSQIRWLRTAQPQCLIGVGGIIRNIGKIDRRRKHYPLDIAHNYSLSYIDVNEIFDLVRTKNSEERKHIDGLSSDRSDIFAGACMEVKSLMEYCGIERLITSGYGLREGLVFKHHIPDGSGITNILDASLENIMDIYRINKTHGFHVYNLYNKLFEELQEVHGITEDMTRIIKTAALLHDIGVNIRFYNHHEHTLYMILNAGITGLSHRELILSAYIAASHRLKKYKFSLDMYKPLLHKGDKLIVKKAGILLQIANSLDRGLGCKIQDVSCQIDEDMVIIRTFSNQDKDLEKNDARQAADIFHKTFYKELMIL